MGGYAAFTERLRVLFRGLLPLYIPRAHSPRGTKVDYKKDETPVTSLDHAAMEQIRALINQEFPGDMTIGEEDKVGEGTMARILADMEGTYWTIDGLDGTWHYRAGTNSFGAMVCQRRGERLLYAAVFRPVDMTLYGTGFVVYDEGTTFECHRDEQLCRRLKAADPDPSRRFTVMLEGSSKRFFSDPIARLGRAVTTRPSLSSSIACTTLARGEVDPSPSVTRPTSSRPPTARRQTAVCSCSG